MDALYRDSQFVIQPAAVAAGQSGMVPNGPTIPGTNYVLSSHPSSSLPSAMGTVSGGPYYSAIAAPLPSSDSKYSRRVGLLDHGDYVGGQQTQQTELDMHYLHLKSATVDCNVGNDLQIELVDSSPPPPPPPLPASLSGTGSSQTNSQASTNNSVTSNGGLETPYATLRSHQIILVGNRFYVLLVFV